jgi:hypothetical protein
VIAAVGGNRVVHVDNGRHLRQLADFVVGLLAPDSRCRRAAWWCSVMSSGIGPISGDSQDVVAIFRMLLDDGKFFVGQRARLVEDFVRHQRLARVVQQTAQAGLMGDFRGILRERQNATSSVHTLTECRKV